LGQIQEILNNDGPDQILGRDTKFPSLSTAAATDSL
jgi:hypothetical protein